MRQGKKAHPAHGSPGVWSLTRWGSGDQCELFPEVVPFSVEVGGFEGGDGEGAVFGPVPAGTFEPDADELFATRLHAAGADWPATVAICGIVQMVALTREIRPQVLQGLARLAASSSQLGREPADQSFAAVVPQLRQRRIGPVVGIGRSHPFGCGPDMFAGVIPVQNPTASPKYRA